MATEFSDETVMRYVDGELDDATCEAIEAAQETDAALARRIEAFAETKIAAREAMRPLLDEPVPHQLQASVEAMVAAHQLASAAAPAASPQRRFTPANDWWKIAAAACIAGVVGALGGHLATPQGSTAADGMQIAAVDRQALAEVLQRVPSGSEQALGDARFTAVASFRDGADALCREFELDMADGSHVTSVACDRDGAWQVRFALNAPAAGEGYAPASSAEALDAWLVTIEAGQPLSAEEEAQALQALPSRE